MAEVDPNTSDTVLHEVDDGIGWLTFNRPAAANAANPEMMRALCTTFDCLAADPAVKAIVLRGNGRHFLAGGDLDWLARIVAGTDTTAAEEIYRWFQGAVKRVMACPKPVVAAVSGAALTVGCELALACDLRLAERNAFFQVGWIDLGLIGPLGAGKLLPQTIGLGRARELYLECRRVEAAEALQIGLISTICEDRDALHATARERGLAMAARPPAAFAGMKALLHDGLGQSLEQFWEAGMAAQAELLAGPAFREAVLARRPGR